jgi:pyrroline-5-carboxylate reductase
VPHDRVRSLVAPADDVSLFIPLPSVATGGCPLPVYPDTGTVRDLFGARNPVIGCASEVALNAHFGACALSLPVMALLTEGRDWLADLTGDPDGAETYVTAMFGAYFAALRADGSGGLESLTKGLSTPGGLNASVRDAMDRAGAPLALRRGLDDLKPRLGLPAS